jgi:hypothetical protein
MQNESIFYGVKISFLQDSCPNMVDFFLPWICSDELRVPDRGHLSVVVQLDQFQLGALGDPGGDLVRDVRVVDMQLTHVRAVHPDILEELGRHVADGEVGQVGQVLEHPTLALMARNSRNLSTN